MLRRISFLTCLVALFSVAAAAVPCQAQLFGGGGFGGGGFGGGGFGGGGFRGGGFGGGRPILGGGRPVVGGGAPIMRPSRPIVRQPIARPAPARPILGGGRPAAGGPLPSRPVLGNRPITDRPVANRPIADRPIADRPAAGPLPGGDRPVLGNRPVAGNLPSVDRLPNLAPPNLPGAVQQPGAGVSRAQLNDFLSGTDRPTTQPLPAGPGDAVTADRDDGPAVGVDAPLVGDRPILDRPIMPNLGEQVLREEIRKEIVARRIERSERVRDRIRELYYRENHPFVYWWHYMWTKHPVWSWWRVTAPYRWADWSSVGSWCGYSGSYSEPVTYEYTDQGVYANGQQVVVDDEYSKQARELAAAGKQLLQDKVEAQEAEKLEWLPLGVFALCQSQEGDPTMFLQLAISREGIVAGSFSNMTTSENLSVQGGADRESTRLAVTIGDQDDVVIETGLYNVTEEQSSAMIHYQDGTREDWLLIKMPDPQGKQAN